MIAYLQNLLGGYNFQYSHLAILAGVLLALYFLWGYMRKPSNPGFNGPVPPGYMGPNGYIQGQNGYPAQGGQPGSQIVQYDQNLPPMPNQGPEGTCSPPMDYTNQGPVPGPTLGPGSSTAAPQVGGAGNKTLVMYYAPWCGFCKKLMPVWDDLANRYGERMQKVDCAALPDEAEKHDIQAFPTVVLFVDGKKARVLKGGGDAATLESLLN
jgi:thioredoxin 1